MQGMDWQSAQGPSAQYVRLDEQHKVTAFSRMDTMEMLEASQSSNKFVRQIKQVAMTQLY